MNVLLYKNTEAYFFISSLFYQYFKYAKKQMHTLFKTIDS